VNEGSQRTLLPLRARRAQVAVLAFRRVVLGPAALSATTAPTTTNNTATHNKYSALRTCRSADQSINTVSVATLTKSNR